MSAPSNCTLGANVAAVLFLLADQAAHITLTDLVVDGGGTLGA